MISFMVAACGWRLQFACFVKILIYVFIISIVSLCLHFSGLKMRQYAELFPIETMC